MQTILVVILPPERSNMTMPRFPNLGCFGPVCLLACTAGYRAYGRLYPRSDINLIHIFQWLSAQVAWVWACCVPCAPQAAHSLGALARRDRAHFVKSGVFEPRPALGYCSDGNMGSNVGKHLNQIWCSSDPVYEARRQVLGVSHTCGHSQPISHSRRGCHHLPTTRK